MGNIISVLYILAFAGCGILTARPIFASDRPLKRILFGLTFGLAAVNGISMNIPEILKNAIPLLLTFSISGICENLSFMPIIGSGALYNLSLRGRSGGHCGRINILCR